MPDVPDIISLIGFIIGLLLIAWAVVPHIHDWLSERVGGCTSIATLAIVACVGTGLLGTEIYRERAYHLKYKVCFNHDTEWSAGGEPKITAIDVAPIWVNDNSFPIATELVDPNLSIGKSASAEGAKVLKLVVPAKSATFGYPDFVEFSPPIRPGPVLGKARYVLRYSRNLSKPLDKTLIVEGAINGAISPDGHMGGFNFVPQSDAEYIPENCRVPKRAYYVRNRRAL